MSVVVMLCITVHFDELCEQSDIFFLAVVDRFHRATMPFLCSELHDTGQFLSAFPLRGQQDYYTFAKQAINTPMRYP
jgi:hypothetical protein